MVGRLNQYLKLIESEVFLNYCKDVCCIKPDVNINAEHFIRSDFLISVDVFSNKRFMGCFVISILEMENLLLESLIKEN